MPIFRPDSSHLTPTGSLKLDFLLGTGGVPGGSLVEIFGPDSCGKTSLCLSIAAEANKLGNRCAFIDADQNLTSNQIHAFGVDPQRTYLVQASQAEQTMDIMERLIRSQAFGVIILDSIDALVPASERISPYGDERIMEIDGILSRSLSKLTALLQRSQTTLILTRMQTASQRTVYHKLSQNTSRLALKLHATISIQLETISYLTRQRSTYGYQVLVNLKKNRFGPCPRTTKLDIMYNDGIIKLGDILDLGLHLKILTKSSQGIFYKDHVLGIHREESLDFLRSAPLVCQQIEKDIRQILFSKNFEND